ncbi:hypothetical protein IWZ00DRAFT_428803, partial [Phyllosticta capitalensis]
MSDPATYTVGWICAITIESVAARQFLDEEHEGPSHVSDKDNNVYVLGRVGGHRVVIAALPDGGYGTASAAGVARDMLHSFPNIRIGLMVGIGGGAPSSKNDIRLGDVVVSSPGNGRGGVFQYDFGKAVQDLEFQHSGFLNQPQTLLLAAVTDLRGRHLTDGNGIHEKIEAILAGKRKQLKRLVQRPDLATDRLFLPEFKHTDSGRSCAEICIDNQDERLGFDVVERLVKRDERSEDDDNPAVHYGLIASANTLMKNAKLRDSFAERHGVLCFEMEAAGLMNHFPCLVIRGICDYSDTHKNNEWQGYAAMTAAAYATDLLRRIAPQRVEAERSLHDHISSIDQKLNDVTTTTQSIKTSIEDTQSERQWRKALDWLCPPDPSTNYQKALRQRHPGSGQWILGDPTYLEWKRKPNSFLWLHGIPGCGKTVLSSTIIESLSRGHAAQSLLYFYFDFSDSSKQSLEAALRSLITQLCRDNENVREHVSRFFAEQNKQHQHANTESLRTLFKHLVQQLGEVWIVLDALDECKTLNDRPDGGLLPWIKSFHDSKSNVHIAALSRPEQNIKAFVERWVRSQNIIEIQSDLVKDDIRAFVHARVREHEGLSRWSSRPKIQEEIENTLLEKANGMFQWVTCQLDALEKCLDPFSLRAALQTLPRTLDETYSRILREIPDERRSSTIRILQFLSYCGTPFTIRAAVDAIAVNSERAPYFDEEDRMPDPKEIAAYCSSLVTVVSWTEWSDDDYDYDPDTDYYEWEETGLQLAHFSVKEYLTSSRIDENFATGLTETVARASIAKICLSYCLGVTDGRSQYTDLAYLDWEFPFLRYATRYWRENARITQESSETVRSLATDFYMTKRCFEIATSDTRGNQCPLHHASHTGIIDVVKVLLQNGADVNAKTFGDETALQFASAAGHLQIVQVLLEHCVFANLQCRFLEDALAVAAEEGHTRRETVRVLLDSGADVNALSSGNETALYAASSERHLQTVRLLLSRGANTELQGDYDGNPLHTASKRGYADVVRTLLNHGSSVNAVFESPGEYPPQRSPLSFALESGDHETVRVLFEHGAEVRQEDNTSGIAVAEAARHGQIHVLHELLKHGAEINTTS